MIWIGHAQDEDGEGTMCVYVFVFVRVCCVIKETQLINKERWCVHSHCGGRARGWVDGIEGYVALLDRLFVCVWPKCPKSRWRGEVYERKVLSGRCVK